MGGNDRPPLVRGRYHRRALHPYNIHPSTVRPRDLSASARILGRSCCPLNLPLKAHVQAQGYDGGIELNTSARLCSGLRLHGKKQHLVHRLEYVACFVDVMEAFNRPPDAWSKVVVEVDCVSSVRDTSRQQR
ncbi:hypothetical protein ZHAS_00010306 [Anopheles sinensis]|uniref:Uncharacterized protein n=1 Tax=Anopheles sinensis TaxID=74873 RepID=A0A084VXA1_ANOSI|nr:hypothetical protein ZHAS_00010306 [Anopheles sinensis]